MEIVKQKEMKTPPPPPKTLIPIEWETIEGDAHKRPPPFPPESRLMNIKVFTEGLTHVFCLLSVG